MLWFGESAFSPEAAGQTLPASPGKPAATFFGVSAFSKGSTAVDPSQPDQPTPATEPPESSPKSPEDQIRQILLTNPNISGATILNLIKSMGMTIESAPSAQEADTASANPIAVASPPSTASKKKTVESAGSFNIKARLMEGLGAPGVGPTSFKTILLQEGLGNLKDNFYYSRQALESAVKNGVFEGKKIYADHPTSLDEQTRPERSVKDVLGHFENVALSEDSDGRAMLEADVRILPDEPYRWARALMSHAVNYAKTFPDKQFVGLSINASGNAQEIDLGQFMSEGSVPAYAMPKLQMAKDQGATTIRVVNEITDAISCDLVTEAGAGGKILNLLEQEKHKMADQKDLKKKEADDTTESKEKKEAAPVPPKAEGAPAPEGSAPPSDEEVKDVPETDGNDDEEEDKELILNMLKKYLGDEVYDESVMSMGKEAWAAAKEMGMEGGEAEKASGYAMKMAKHMAKKKAAPSTAAVPQAEAAAAPCDPKESGKQTKVTESIKLAARVAFLEGELKKREVAEHLEKKLAECGLPNKATKIFREQVGQPKSKEDIDKALKMFVEAYNARGESESGLSFMIQPEKTSSDTRNAISFADCKN